MINISIVHIVCIRYLKSEWGSRHPATESPTASPNYDPTETNFPTIEVKAPRQPNGTDCGVYTIKFAELILREPPSTTRTAIKEGLRSYVGPESVPHEDVQRMRVEMRETLNELHAHYTDRQARLKVEKEERRAKRLQEKNALAAAIAAGNPSTDAVESKIPDDYVSPADDNSSTDTTSTSSVVKPISPAAKDLFARSLNGTTTSQQEEQQQERSQKKQLHGGQSPKQSESNENTDLVTVADDFDAIFCPPSKDTERKEASDEEEIPQSRAAKRVFQTFKSSSTSSANKSARKIKQPIETESDEITPPQTDTVNEAATPESTGSVSAAHFQTTSYGENVSGSVNGVNGSGKKRRKQPSTEAAVDTLNPTQGSDMVDFFTINIHSQNSLLTAEPSGTATDDDRVRGRDDEPVSDSNSNAQMKRS